MSKLVFFSFLIVATLTLVDSAGQTKLPVSVYYESLCPDSIKFVTNQLYTTYTSPLRRYLDITLVPYGKSSHKLGSDGQWEFTCHHGEAECYGNKVQACILKHINEESDRLKYINCLMSLALSNKNFYPVSKCASDNQLDSSAVVSCANGTEGNELLAEQGDKTLQLRPPLTSVPTVVFNENYNKKDQDLSMTNFKTVLCSYINKDDRPRECNAPNNASKLTFSFLSVFFVASRLFL